jgi:SRSO17 transposase
MASETTTGSNIEIVRELTTGLGLDHLEGRSFAGWHRHVTLAVLAQAFCTMIRADPKVPAPG